MVNLGSMKSDIRPWGNPVDREAFILQHAEGRRVLHVGCADWPYTAERLATCQLLHSRLLQVSARVTGVDTSERGIELLSAAGCDDLYLVDPSEPIAQQVAGMFECIVVGEVLEHVANPSALLQGLHGVVGRDTDVVITVPNFSSVRRNVQLLRGVEAVHPDHFYYFSPATITRLLDECGFQLVRGAMYWSSSGRLGAVTKMLSRVRPFQLMGDGLALVARPAS